MKRSGTFFFITFLSKSTFRMQKNFANANTLGDLSDRCKVGDFQLSMHGSVVEMNFVEIYLAKHGRNKLCGEPKSCTALVKFVQLNWPLGHNVLYSDKFHSSK